MTDVVKKIPTRPLVPIAVSFIIGIILADHKIITQKSSQVGFLVFIIIWSIFYLTRRFSVARIIVIWILCLLAGSFRLIAFNHLPSSHIGHFQAEDVPIKITGVVKDDIIIKNRSESEDKFWNQIRGVFAISAEKLRSREEEIEVTGKIRINFYGFIPQIKYGDRVEILGLINSPKEPSNPGGFDYRQYLKRKGVHKIVSLSKPEDIKVIGENNGNFLVSLVRSLRHKLSKQIDFDFSKNQAGVLKALLLGKKSDLPEDTKDDFLRTGTIHFLNVSGLHLVMVLGIWFWLLGLFMIKDRLRIIIVIAVVLFYMALTGGHYPVVRAGIMALVYISAELFKRKSNSVNNLALAGLVILAINPNELFSMGFQLSFICVLAIITFYKKFISIFSKEDRVLEAILPESFIEKLWRITKLYFLKGFAVSTAAWLGSFMIILCAFNIIVPVTLLANIILGIVIFIILPVGLLYLPLGFIGIPFLLTDLLFILVNVATWLVNLITHVPFGHFYLPDIPIWIVLGYYAVFCMWYFKGYLYLLNIYLIGVTTAIVLAFIGWSILSFNNSDTGKLKVTMIDVGNGASFFVELPDGSNMLYDAGSKNNFDVGKTSIAPLLWSKGVTRIDKVVLSHPDLDHINGIPSLMERFKIGEVLISDYWFENDKEKHGQRLILLISPDKIRRVKKGDEIIKRKDFTVGVLGPPTRNEISQKTGAFRDNDTSVILKIDFKNESVLFTGDIQSSGIGWLLEDGNEDIRSTVMQIPHHGYKEKKIENLLDVVQPKYVLANSTYMSISEETTAICEEKGIDIFTSHEYGALEIEIAESGINIRD